MENVEVIQIAVVESDPLRFVGFRALLESEADFRLTSLSSEEVASRQDIDVAFLEDRDGRDLFRVMDTLKAANSNLRVIVTGCGPQEESSLKAISSGAKGYIQDAASGAEFAQAIRTVHKGLIWAPRRVIAKFIEHSSTSLPRNSPLRRTSFTGRETQVLQLLVAGRSNKEIAAPLGIEERTVKAHVAKLMRKVGVQNRIALSVQAVTRALVSPN